MPVDVTCTSIAWPAVTAIPAARLLPNVAPLATTQVSDCELPSRRTVKVVVPITLAERRHQKSVNVCVTGTTPWTLDSMLESEEVPMNRPDWMLKPAVAMSHDDRAAPAAAGRTGGASGAGRTGGTARTSGAGHALVARRTSRAGGTKPARSGRLGPQAQSLRSPPCRPLCPDRRSGRSGRRAGRPLWAGRTGGAGAVPGHLVLVLPTVAVLGLHLVVDDAGVPVGVVHTRLDLFGARSRGSQQRDQHREADRHRDREEWT